MKTNDDYTRAIDLEVPIAMVYCDYETIEALKGKLDFESEDSNTQPEPSYACRARSTAGIDFLLLYFPHRQLIAVCSEAGVDIQVARAVFFNEVPELKEERRA